MTKFEELCAAYKKAQSEFKQYKDDCHDFAADLWNKVALYFQIPTSQLTLYNIDEEGEYQATAPPIINALSLWPDAYWQIGFGITLFEKKDTYPQETIIIGLGLKRDLENNYFVRLKGSDQEFQIDRKSEADFNKFFDYLFKEVQKSYSTGLQTFIDQDTTFRKIGFKLNQEPEL